MIRAPLSSGLQQAVRKIANKLTRSPWKPLAKPVGKGPKPAEVGRGLPGGETGVAE